MAHLRNNVELDLSLDPSVLNAQVRIIQRYKHIKDYKDLKDATGINNDYLRHVLQNKNEIISKWKRFCRHADDSDGIDALLLGYISHCKQRKIKPSVPMLMSEVERLLKILKVHPYHIKPYIWTIIGQSPFNKLKVGNATNMKSVQICSLVDILLEDGKRLLQPETHKRFLKSVETIKENERKTVTNNKGNSHKSNTTSSDDVPQNTELLKIKEEPLEYESNTNTNKNFRPEFIKFEITDDYKHEEFISFSEDNEKDLHKTTVSINESSGHQQAEIKNANKNENLSDIDITIKKELSDSSCPQIQIDTSSNKLEDSGNKDNGEFEDEIVLEIEDCDKDAQVEFLEAINKYIEDCSSSEEDVKIIESNIKEEPIEIDSDEEDDSEVVTILEIISDDDADDINIKKDSVNKSESLLKSSILENIKRIKNEKGDDPSSISHSSLHW